MNKTPNTKFLAGALLLSTLFIGCAVEKTVERTEISVTPGPKLMTGEISTQETYFDQDSQIFGQAQEMNMNAGVQWMEAKVDDLTFQIPYSDEWRIAGQKVAPFTITDFQENEKGVYFGKYVTDGSGAAVREYLLNITTDAEPHNIPQENQCAERVDQNLKALEHHTPPEALTIGEINGVAYLSGGVGECATLFDFRIGNNHDFFLRKKYPAGVKNNDHVITDDMRKIIQSITVN